MTTTVGRDPEARGEYKRFFKTTRNLNNCDWCGTYRKVLYSYVWWADDKREPVLNSGHWFCNLECHNNYTR